MDGISWGAVIVAAGTGSRFGTVTPKQFNRLLGRKVIDWSLGVFGAMDSIDEIVVVLPRDDDSWMPFWTPPEDVTVALGGERRQDSVLAGLRMLGPVSHVLIHDAARPLISRGLIERIMDKAERLGSVIPVIAVRDTVKKVSDENTVEKTLSRKHLRLSQTPQAFRLAEILEALEGSSDVTDECSAMEVSGRQISTVPGDWRNMKITDPGDLELASLIAGRYMERRSALGIDFHPFRKGRKLVLGGCVFDHAEGLDGHSDGDAVLHAVADALLSAARMGDIGEHFPPGDPRWKDVDSSEILTRAAGMLAKSGWIIDQVDVTIIALEPKISPARQRMIQRISGILSVPEERIWVKGTTTNTLGEIGRGRGIGCIAAAVISRYRESAGDHGAN